MTRREEKRVYTATLMLLLPPHDIVWASCVLLAPPLLRKVEVDFSKPRGFFSFTQTRARRRPRTGPWTAPLGMPEVGDRAGSRAHSFRSGKPQGGHNPVVGA